MQILFFGTFDERTHPRVRALREGLQHHGASVADCNAPLDLDTAARVELVRRPWRAPLLVLRILGCWMRLLWLSRGLHPDVVVVGYLGHFDVHLARLRFRRARIVLDHLVGLGDTARDRGLAGRSGMGRVLDRIDHWALRAADLVVVDTDEQGALLPSGARSKVVVVPVGAPGAWFAARSAHRAAGELRVIFFGLYTPLQGAPVIGAALRLAAGAPLRCTMVGKGQDLGATRAAVGDDPRVTWVDWVGSDDLPRLVAEHDVCLGIFDDGRKAQRVVPNKVFQGAAAGCAIVTSDTPPQRRILGDAAVLVPPGDAAALAEALTRLAKIPDEVATRRAAAARLADEHLTAQAVVAPLVSRLEAPA